MYLPSPSATGYFMLPTDAADKGLKLAGAAQLKVLLAVYRNIGSPAELDRIAALTGLSEGDARDALEYWVGRGLIVRQSAQGPQPAEAAAAEPAPAEKKTAAQKTEIAPAAENGSRAQEKKRLTQAIRPTTQQINARCEEDPEIRGFFQQIQKVLGRTIGYDSQAPLLLCIDYLGLPPPVVLMICEYAKMNGKCGFSYILSLAEDWANEGVDTVETANAHIAALESAAAIWKPFAARIGSANPAPSKKQGEYLFKWSASFGFGLDEILLAYDEMADHTASFSFAYMDKVLSNWHAAGLKTAAQIKRYLQKKAEEREANAGAAAPVPRKSAAGGKDKPAGRATASYDIAAAENAAAQGAPVYERKKKKK